MKCLLIALLILATLQQENTTLALSGDQSSSVGNNSQGDSSVIPQTITRSKSQPAAPSDWSILNQNSLGGSARWITPDGTQKIWPKWWLTNYYITFYTDCPQNPVIFTILTTGFFRVYLNETLIRDWDIAWLNSITFSFKPLCGCNVLRVQVFNWWWPSPLGIIYSLTQSTSGCYDCPNLGVTYYNRQTCKCECVNTYKCTNPLMQWSGVSQCACICNPQRNDKWCAPYKFWNMQNCSCQCRKICCPKGYIQDPQTCKCKPSCPEQKCPGNLTWDFNSCSCICIKYMECAPDYQWNNDSCSCRPKCPYGSCTGNKTWDNVTCTCVCNITTCPANSVFDYQNCRCNCLTVQDCGTGYRWDESLCKCVPCMISCPTGYILDKNCQCVNPCQKWLTQKTQYPPPCPPKMVWDYNTCQCICAISCLPGYILDPYTCNCSPKDQGSCPFNQVWDGKKCICKQSLRCNGSATWNDTVCQCQCNVNRPIYCFIGTFDYSPSVCSCPNGGSTTTNPVTCPYNQIWDSIQGKCVCRIATPCKGRAVWNSTSCQCQCYIDPRTVFCSSGTFDNNPNVCSCPTPVITTPVNCNINQIWDSAQGKCVCRTIQNCKGRSTWNNVTCQCQCLLNAKSISCYNGYFDSNPNVCSCVTNLSTGGVNVLSSNVNLASNIVPSS